jgi:hypothetical protein
MYLIVKEMWGYVWEDDRWGMGKMWKKSFFEGGSQGAMVMWP